MWLQFLLENSHFALNLFGALVCFAVFWLLFDAWLGRRDLKEALKFTGFLLLAISFLIHATQVESPLLQIGQFERGLIPLLPIVIRISGYLLIIFGQLLDPLQKKPETSGIIRPVVPGVLILTGQMSWIAYTLPVLALISALLYLRRATIGLENHLRPVAYGFLLIFLSEVLSLRSLFLQTKSIDLYNLVAPYGIIWFSEHTLLLLGLGVLGWWVLGYLLKRLQSQLFMMFNIVILIVFLLTTVSFTTLLLNNLQTESLNQLETNVKVLNLAIESKKSESLSDAQVVAQNRVVAIAMGAHDKNSLAVFTSEYLLTKKQSFLVIVDDNAQVLARGEDKDRVGDSLSSDTLIRRALLGESGSSVVSIDGVLAPSVYVRSAVPVKNGNEVIGAVLTGVILDDAFVDGLKAATGLETSIYSDDKLSATTQINTTSAERVVGIKDTNPKVKQNVLVNGEGYNGTINLLNRPYLASYLPLKDIDNQVVGMLFVGQLESGVLLTAGRSIELTFLITTLLLILSIIPAYFISRNLANQLK